MLVVIGKGPISESAAKLTFSQSLVKQISPDKNADFRHTAASFTLTTLDHRASLSCASSPPEQALYDVSVRQLVALLAASSPLNLAVSQLPFASS